VISSNNFYYFCKKFKEKIKMAKYKIDEIDHQILDMLIENTRIPFTDIAKKLVISAGTVHVRVKKMEDAGIIQGSSLTLDYKKLGYSFIAYVGLYLNNTSQTKFVLERINNIPYVTVAHITTGKFNIFCKIRAKNTSHAKDVIFMLDDIEGVYRTETMISLEESINDKKRLMHTIFNDL
jgi:Lrp/AsnC family transcriptional regulator for asnA, asnC and gidA